MDDNEPTPTFAFPNLSMQEVVDIGARHRSTAPPDQQAATLKLQNVASGQGTLFSVGVGDAIRSGMTRDELIAVIDYCIPLCEKYAAASRAKLS